MKIRCNREIISGVIFVVLSAVLWFLKMLIKVLLLVMI